MMGDIYNMGGFLANWVQEQFSESGISGRVDHAGMELTIGPPRGIRINYFDINGDQVKNYYRVRVHPEDSKDEQPEYGAAKFGKYWQPKGLYQRLYWPRVLGVDHAANVADIGCPIFLVEGEKKALAFQSALMSLGIKGSVAGIPGVRVGNDLLKELGSIPWCVTSKNQQLQRPTWLVFDWNDHDRAEADTRKGESLIVSALHPLHADLMCLRWDIPPDAQGSTLHSGVQKVDDWLVAGGNLAQALESSMEADFMGGNELMQKMLMFNEHWGMIKGVFMMIDGPNRGAILTRTQFLDETAEHFVLDTSGKKVVKLPVAKAWVEWPGKRKIDGFTVLPPALGEPLQEWVNGKLNMAEAWAPIEEPPPWADAPRTQLIDTLLENFCDGPAHFKWLRQHIAHMLLHPDVPTSQVILLCGKPGSGKSLLMDSFRRLAHKDLLGGLVKSVTLDRKDDFNRAMEGTICAIYEEPMKGNHGKDIETIIKKITGSKILEIRAMRMDPYQVPNYIHLFVTMNLRYLAHLGKDDRRCNFFEGKEKIGLDGTGFGKTYDEFMADDDFTPSWLFWARSVDLEGYSPQLLGPQSRARLTALGFSSNGEEDFINAEEFEECGVFTPIALMAIWDANNPRKAISSTKLGLILIEAGWTKRLISVNGAKTRFWGRAEWAEKGNAEWLEEAQKAGKLPPGIKY